MMIDLFVAGFPTPVTAAAAFEAGFIESMSAAVKFRNVIDCAHSDLDRNSPHANFVKTQYTKFNKLGERFDKKNTEDGSNGDELEGDDDEADNEDATLIFELIDIMFKYGHILPSSNYLGAVCPPSPGTGAVGFPSPSFNSTKQTSGVLSSDLEVEVAETDRSGGNVNDRRKSRGGSVWASVAQARSSMNHASTFVSIPKGVSKTSLKPKTLSSSRLIDSSECLVDLGENGNETDSGAIFEQSCPSGTQYSSASRGRSNSNSTIRTIEEDIDAACSLTQIVQGEVKEKRCLSTHYPSFYISPSSSNSSLEN